MSSTPFSTLVCVKVWNLQSVGLQVGFTSPQRSPVLTPTSPFPRWFVHEARPTTKARLPLSLIDVIPKPESKILPTTFQKPVDPTKAPTNDQHLPANDEYPKSNKTRNRVTQGLPAKTSCALAAAWCAGRGGRCCGGPSPTRSRTRPSGVTSVRS